MGARAKNSASVETGSTPARPRLPPLKALLAFEAAARHGNFASGAGELGVTPSAVSHQIQQLEAFLGVPLFERRAGRAVLTNAGRTYAGEIAHAVGVISGATALVAPQSQTGHLVIASGPSFAAKWLQPRLPDFLRLHPEVRIRLSTISSYDDLESSRFDIAIAYGSPPAGQRQVEPLLTERLRPLCNPKLATTLDLKTPKDLARATLIHSVNALPWAEYLRRVGADAIRPANELWLDRSTMAIDAAVDGLGIVLESEILAAEEMANGQLIAPFGGAAQVEATSYFLIRSARIRPGRQSMDFVKWLRAAIADANLAMTG